MNLFLETLKQRNEPLYYFGLINILLAVLFLVLTRISTVEISGANAWYKPFKFALSIGVYSWTMAWYCHYLSGFNQSLFNGSIILLLGFEIIYIGLQAYRGQLSHFNLSSPLYSGLYRAMAAAATIVTLYTAYVGVLFFQSGVADIPVYYQWGIRLGIIIFVVFSLEGFVMGARLSHSIGGPDGGQGLPLVNWSKKYGDPRIAHFIGMHALQLIPLAAYYLFRNTGAVFAVGIAYALLAVFTLLQALQGKPFIKT